MGQLHAHFRPEDPLKWLESFKVLPTANNVESRYKAAEYDFVALTEHNEIVPDPGVGEGLLHISNSEEITPDGKGGHILAVGINELISYALPDQDKINNVNNQGGIPILAHPNYHPYPWSVNSLIKLRNYQHLEIFQGAGRYLAPFSLYFGDYYATDKFDFLASGGKKIFGTAGDDYTPNDGGFDQAAVTVFSETKDQPAIMQNLKDGNFYARQGSSAPNINISISGPTIYITSDKISEIKFIGYGGKVLKVENLTQSSSYQSTGDETYVRVEVTCANGIDLRTSWTQPILVSKIRVSQTLISGEHYIDLGQAGLISNSSSSINASVLSSSQYPTQSPPLGYLSPVYSFATAGQVLDGTNLSVSYADKNIFTNEDNLAIYTYDEANSVWNKMTSYVDKVDKVVSANLSHFSLYTLGAEQPEDTEKPVVSLKSPIDLNNLSGKVDFEASISDNNAVIETRFFIDDKLITRDTDSSDGWKSAVDTNDFTVGSHKLKLEAEDFSGNIGIFETNFTIIDSTFVAPTISITSPTENQYLKNNFTISGDYSSNNDVKSVSIFLNNIYITDTDFSNGTFQKEIDFNQFKEGNHTLKVELIDVKGNTAESVRTINIGDELKVEIISPQNKTYFHSESILFQYQSTPVNADGVTAKIDGIEIANNITKNAYEFSLGQHKYSVEKNSKVYAETNFSISTNLVDQIKLTGIMYMTGHVKSRSISMTIQVRLVLAQLFEKLKMRNLRNIVIQDTIKFINQQNTQKEPLIDDFARNLLENDLKYILSSV